MALSNIFREPRREITESLVGILPLIAFIWTSWYLTDWIWPPEMRANSVDRAFAFGVTMIILLVGVLILWVLLIVTHAIGETICDSLARRGLELRPKNRP